MATTAAAAAAFQETVEAVGLEETMTRLRIAEVLIHTLRTSGWQLLFDGHPVSSALPVSQGPPAASVCRTCDFFLAYLLPPETARGTCCRYPPVGGAAWAETRSTDWCGEYRER